MLGQREKASLSQPKKGDGAVRGIFNRGYVCIYELPEEVMYTEDGCAKSAIADEGLYGQRFDIIEKYIENDGNFVRIRTDYGYDGYVKNNEILIYNENSINEYFINENSINENSIYGGSYVYGEKCEDAALCKNKCGKDGFVQVKNAVADIMAAPFVSSIRLMTVTRGAVLMCSDLVYGINTVEEAINDNKKTDNGYVKNGYVCVKLYDGRKGYIKESYIEAYVTPLDQAYIEQLDEAAFRERLVLTAKSYLGVQYRWGGKTPLGIDCSGLTSMSYMLNGVYIYRDAKLMPGFPVRQIPFQQMKKGDLLYFPGHIAMYIGDEKYIHSTAMPGSDGVVINSFNPCSELFRADLAESIYAVGSIFT